MFECAERPDRLILIELQENMKGIVRGLWPIEAAVGVTANRTTSPLDHEAIQAPESYAKAVTSALCLGELHRLRPAELRWVLKIAN